jgi:peptidoglycan/LPS O-acetylase OafA/YrhL
MRRGKLQNDRPADLVSIQFLRGIAASMVVFHHALAQFASNS